MSARPSAFAQSAQTLPTSASSFSSDLRNCPPQPGIHYSRSCNVKNSEISSDSSESPQPPPPCRLSPAGASCPASWWPPWPCRTSASGRPGGSTGTGSPPRGSRWKSPWGGREFFVSLEQGLGSRGGEDLAKSWRGLGKVVTNQSILGQNLVVYRSNRAPILIESDRIVCI